MSRTLVPRPVRRLWAIAALTAAPLAAQSPAVSLTVERIFRTRDFSAQGLPFVQWMKDGRSYLNVRSDIGSTMLVQVDAATGAETVLVPAGVLKDASGAAIDVEDVTLSPDETKALIFHSSVRVWRTNTRGVYHVVDLATHAVTPLVGTSAPTETPAPADAPPGPGFLATGLASGAADPTLQMFAKFSPDGRKVAFGRANDLWVKDLQTGTTTRLTTDGSDDVINGTSDWVYEEELGLRDAFRWSPDSRRLAFWRFDQSAVPAFPIIDELTTYPRVSTLRYPKAGAANSRVTIHVIDADGGNRHPLDVGPDTGQYITRLEWVDADSISVQRMPRRQVQLDVMLVSATTGTGRTIVSERDSAYVNSEGEPVVWLADRQRFLLRSDRSGWQQYYLYRRDGRLVTRVTADSMDVLDLLAIDERARAAYVLVAAPTATQQQLMRVTLDGRRAERLTRGDGAHAMLVSPTASFVFDAYSRLGVPPVVSLLALPRMTKVKELTDNAAVRSRLVALGVQPAQLFTIPMPDGTLLDAYRILPPAFDSTRRYPVLMHAYGGPAAPQVIDQWGGPRYLWHLSMAQQGYVVVVVDNRGAAFRGRAFRKVTQLRLGLQETADQLDAARWLGRQPWVDAARIGFWGWSFGGYLATMAAARGGDLFRAVIAVAPVTDWRLYDSIYTERFMWTPQENPTGYQETAPQLVAAGIRARFLLVHGTGDDNVHPQNSVQLIDRMVRANRPMQQLFYPNRTHAISGGNTTVHLYESLTRFLRENL
ncbi:MAG: DPP IV N-terminal domain-containing protein [Gemmatimonadaceae bacterium]|nr:DPP IV N-terminal domain-containing protein [Gemmatimonadaceae bacterium]